MRKAASWRPAPASPDTASDTATSPCARVVMATMSLQTSPPAGTVTFLRPSKVTVLGSPASAASLPLLGATVAASKVSGLVPKVFCTRIRRASPPWLRRLIIRTD